MLSPAQIVAINLKRAREMRKLTQGEAATLLEPYLGTRWSKASFSAAEAGSLKGDKIRQFSADDLVAFAQAFDLPVTWFFIPPATWEDRPVKVKRPGAANSATLTPAELVDLVFAQSSDLTEHLRDTLARIPVDERTRGQQDWAATPLSSLAAALDSVGDAGRLAETLRRVADLLLDAREHYKHTVEDALGAEMESDAIRDSR